MRLDQVLRRRPGHRGRDRHPGVSSRIEIGQVDRHARHGRGPDAERAPPSGPAAWLTGRSKEQEPRESDRGRQSATSIPGCAMASRLATTARSPTVSRRRRRPTARLAQPRSTRGGRTRRRRGRSRSRPSPASRCAPCRPPSAAEANSKATVHQATTRPPDRLERAQDHQRRRRHRERQQQPVRDRCRQDACERRGGRRAQVAVQGQAGPEAQGQRVDRLAGHARGRHRRAPVQRHEGALVALEIVRARRPRAPRRRAPRTRSA